jgi:hypothetical protein
MTPVSEVVWKEFLRKLEEEEEGGEGKMGRPSRGVFEGM